MKLWWCLIMVTGVALSMMAITASAESDLWEEDDKEVLVRTVRATKDRASGSPASCRYVKGAWSDCDPKTNTRSRSLTLKKGDKSCEQTKTIQKKCKKACRYGKGTFSGCVNLSMTRVDTLKPNSDPTCEQSRTITKRCKPENNPKKANKGDRSNKKTGKQPFIQGTSKPMCFDKRSIDDRSRERSNLTAASVASLGGSTSLALGFVGIVDAQATVGGQQCRQPERRPQRRRKRQIRSGNPGAKSDTSVIYLRHRYVLDYG